MRTLLLVFGIGLVVGISYGMHGPVLPVFAKNEIGASYADLGLIGLANFAPYMAVPLFVGFVMSRFAGSYLLVIGVITNAISVYLLSVAETVPEVVGYRIMTGVAHAFFWPPCESLVSENSPNGTRVRNMSLFTMFFVIGFMAGPLIGGFLLHDAEMTIRMLFQVTSFVLAAGLVFAVGMIRNGSARADCARGKQVSLSALAQFARFPVVIMMLVYCTAAFSVMLAIFPAFLSEKKVSEFDIMLLYFVFGMARVTTLAAGGRLARHAHPVLALGAFSIAAGMACAYVSDTVPLFAASMVLTGFGFSVFFPLTLEIILSRTAGHAGVFIGAYETVFGIGWVVGPVIAGYISEYSESAVPYAAFAAAGAAVGTASLFSRSALSKN